MPLRHLVELDLVAGLWPRHLIPRPFAFAAPALQPGILRWLQRLREILTLEAPLVLVGVGDYSPFWLCERKFLFPLLVRSITDGFIMCVDFGLNRIDLLI